MNNSWMIFTSVALAVLVQALVPRPTTAAIWSPADHDSESQGPTKRTQEAWSGPIMYRSVNESWHLTLHQAKVAIGKGDNKYIDTPGWDNAQVNIQTTIRTRDACEALSGWQVIRSTRTYENAEVSADLLGWSRAKGSRTLLGVSPLRWRPMMLAWQEDSKSYSLAMKGEGNSHTGAGVSVLPGESFDLLALQGAADREEEVDVPARDFLRMLASQNSILAGTSLEKSADDNLESLGGIVWVAIRAFPYLENLDGTVKGIQPERKESTGEAHRAYRINLSSGACGSDSIGILKGARMADLTPRQREWRIDEIRIEGHYEGLADVAAKVNAGRERTLDLVGTVRLRCEMDGAWGGWGELADGAQFTVEISGEHHLTVKINQE